MTDDDATTALSTPTAPRPTGPGDEVPGPPGDDVGGIEVGEAAGRVLVRMWGEVDAALRDQASLAMVQCLQRGLPVTVDARDLTFIDSSGLAFVLQLHKVGHDEGLPLVLRDAPDLLLDLLEMVGMADAIARESTDGGPAVLVP